MEANIVASMKSGAKLKELIEGMNNGDFRAIFLFKTGDEKEPIFIHTLNISQDAIMIARFDLIREAIKERIEAFLFAYTKWWHKK